MIKESSKTINSLALHADLLAKELLGRYPNFLEELERKSPELRAYLDTALMSATFAVAIIHSQSQTVYFANAEFLRICGLGVTLTDLPPPWKEYQLFDEKGVAASWDQMPIHRCEVVQEYCPAESFTVIRNNGSLAVKTDGQPLLNSEGEVIASLLTLMDMTARAEAESQFRKLANSAPIILWTADENGKCDYINDRWRQFAGWPPDRIISDDSDFGLHPDDLTRRETLWRHSLNKSVPFQGQFRYLAADGVYRWMSVLGIPEKDESGKAVKWFGYTLDEDERRKHEDEVRRRERQSRQIVESLPSIAWLKDEKGALEFISPQFFHFTGKSVHEAVDESFYSSISPDDLPRLQALQVAGLQTGKGFALELQIRNRNGEYEWFEVKSTPLTSDDAVAKRWFGVATNVNGLRRAAEEALNNEAKLRNSFESTSDGVILTDSNGVILYANGVANRLVSSERSLETQSVFELFPLPLDPESALPNRIKVDSNGKLEIEVFSLKLRVWFDLKISASGDGFVIFFNDASSRRDAERMQREMNERLERMVEERTIELQNANRELEGFTYTVSHDLRGPIRALIGIATILNEDYGDSFDEEGTRLLTRLRANGRKLGQLVDDLLKLSRINREPINSEEFSLTELANEVIAEWDLKDDPRQFEFKVHPNMVIHGEPKLIKLAMENLIENAIKFSPAGGVVEVGSEPGGGFFVADQGVGFKMEYAERIFGPFERLHREEEYSGTGIGLANVQRIVHRHGGNVSAHSEPGKGAKITFSIPESLQTANDELVTE